MTAILASAQITCDDCGRTLRRNAPPHTPDTPRTRAQLELHMIRYATDRHWSREGTSLLAGDLCPRCIARLRTGTP